MALWDDSPVRDGRREEMTRPEDDAKLDEGWAEWRHGDAGRSGAGGDEDMISASRSSNR